MKKVLFILIILLFGISGCSRKHFIPPVYHSGSASLIIDLPDAGQVEIVCSTDNFRIHAMKKNSDGLWAVTLPAKPEFRYFYLVDGSAFIPECPLKEKDDFGFYNCIHIQKRL